MRRSGSCTSTQDGIRWLVKRKHLDAYIEGQDEGADSDAAEVAAVLAYRSPTRRKR
jgi:hypothetical protein